MVTYKTKDDRKFTAKSDKELIQKMRSDSINPMESLRAFMERMAENCWMYNNSKIDTSTYKSLVDDLIEKGFLEIIVED